MRKTTFILSTFVAGVLGAASLAVAQSQELRIRFNTCSGDQPCIAAGGFTVLDKRALASGPARQRNPELSSDQIVVRAYDRAGTLLFTQLVRDPRVLRSESPGPSGELSGQVLQHPTPEFLVSLPDSPTASELRFYHPRRTASGFVLDLLGTVALN